MPDRLIREACCVSDTLNKLSDFEERCWWRLLVNCDDYGRMDGRSTVLKGRLFPLRDGVTCKWVDNAIRRLASVGLVKLYEVESRPYLQVVNWEKHQRIRAKRSRFPAPPQEDGQHMTTSDDICCRNPIQSESESESKSESESESICPKGGGREIEEKFMLFWDVYPRKVGKHEAWKAFSKAMEMVSLEKILDAVAQHRIAFHWDREGGRFIPYPATWLNQQRWEDETKVDVRGSGMSDTFRQLDKVI